MLIHGNFVYTGILQAIDATSHAIGCKRCNKFNFHREHTVQNAIDPKINDGKKRKEKNRIVCYQSNWKTTETKTVAAKVNHFK